MDAEHSVGDPIIKPDMMVILGMVLHGLFSLYYIAVLDKKTPLQDRRELLRSCSTLHTSTHSFQVIWIRYKWEVPK